MFLVLGVLLNFKLNLDTEVTFHIARHSTLNCLNIGNIYIDMITGAITPDWIVSYVAVQQAPGLNVELPRILD